MACLLGIQNEIQAVCYVNKSYMNIGDKRYLRVCSERRIKQLSAVSCRISFSLSETLESVAAEILITKLA